MKASFLIICLLLINASHSSNEQSEESIKMKRTSCYVLARNYVSELESKLFVLIKDVGVEERQRYISKLFAAMGQLCQDNISQSQVQQFYVASDDLEIQNLFYLFKGLDLVDVLSDLELTPRQREIATFQIHLQSSFNKEQEEEGHYNEDF